MIGIVDYNAGNIKSVERALASLGIEYCMSKNPKDLVHADKIIFPGVGDANFAMNELEKSGFDSFLKDIVAQGKILLGICLGSQIIFEHSEEGDTKCLGLLKGSIRHFSTIHDNLTDSPEKTALSTLKIPHMGWNAVTYTSETQNFCPIMKNIPNNKDFYFVHSYVIQPEDSSIVAGYANYGIKVPAIIHRNNIFAMQCHPEKSAKWGLQVLKNFADLESDLELNSKLSSGQVSIPKSNEGIVLKKSSTSNKGDLSC